MENRNEEEPPKIVVGGFNGITLECNMDSEKEVDDFMNLVGKHGGVILNKLKKFLRIDIVEISNNF